MQRKVVLSLLFAACALVPLSVSRAQTYYIDEATDFTGNGCPEANDLNTVTASLQSYMNAAGWTGPRYVNPDAWPQDFVESCSGTYGAGGLDSIYGDSKLLSVYAGHGDRGFIAFGYPHEGRCSNVFHNSMRIGSMSGGATGVAMFITSCTLALDSLVNEANSQWVRQQLGFHNSPSVGGDDPRNFFAETTPSWGHNKESWLDNLEDRPGWFTGDNSPMVVSYGATSAEAVNVHQTASLGFQVLTSPRGGGPSCGAGQPGFWYVYSYLDHGGC